MDTFYCLVTDIHSDEPCDHDVCAEFAEAEILMLTQGVTA